MAAPETIENLALWDALDTTHPSHTKKFTRAGGFKGTAIKPIYTEHKMTEVFGPVGKGWGIGKPEYQVVPGSEGQVAVYCTVELWYAHPNDGIICTGVYGVGGDLVVVKQSGSLRTDDEAFKKAFTDALGNAMKHLGMSADVHMGLFDDSKYVRDLEAEFSGPTRQDKPDLTITKAHADELEALIKRSGADTDRFLAHFRVDYLMDLPAGQFARAKAMLEAKAQQSRPALVPVDPTGQFDAMDEAAQ